MATPCSRLTTLLLLALLAAPAAAARQEATPEPRHGNSYEIRFLDIHAAEALAWESCTERSRCEVQAESYDNDPKKRGALRVNADGATHARIAQALMREDSRPETYSFQVSFMAASKQADGANPGLASGVQKALGDLQGFLPFKSYRQLDSAWLRTARAGNLRLTGMGGQEYQINLSFRSFGTRAERSLVVDRFQLVEDSSAMPAPATPSAPADGEKGIPPPPRRSRELISTSFGLKAGETIVVGTSNLPGTDEALVVLLTAVPAP